MFILVYFQFVIIASAEIQEKNCIYYVIRSNYSAVITQIETVLQLCGPREYIRDADGVMRTGLLT